MILSHFQLQNGYLQKYEQIAEKTYREDFFSEEKACALLEEGRLPEKVCRYILDFLHVADDKVKRFMWLYYYLQFRSEEDFVFDIWELDKIPVPQQWEEAYPGAIKGTVYLFAYENIKQWVMERNLSKDIALGYFNRYIYFTQLNEITHKTVGLCRLSPFLYAYAKAALLLIGRLSFQYSKFSDCVELYENKEGKRLFVATQKYCYGPDGLQADEGFYPVHRLTQGRLLAHTFRENGRLKLEPEEIDLSEYQLRLSEQDAVVGVHIPEGGKLLPQVVRASMLEAKRIFETYHPDVKGFRCRTWFIDPGIRHILPKGGNLEAFADMFDTVSSQDNKYHSLFEHIFKTGRCEFSQLVPRNKFQQDILDYVTAGNRLFWATGVLKADYFSEYNPVGHTGGHAMMTTTASATTLNNAPGLWREVLI